MSGFSNLMRPDILIVISLYSKNFLKTNRFSSKNCGVRSIRPFL